MGAFKIDLTRFRIRDGRILALFDFTDTDTGVGYRDFRLIRGPYGNFVASPSWEYEKLGQKEYRNYVYTPHGSARGREWFTRLAAEAMRAYDLVQSWNREDIPETDGESVPEIILPF